MSDIKHACHKVYIIKYHLIFIVKYRKDLFLNNDYVEYLKSAKSSSWSERPDGELAQKL